MKKPIKRRSRLNTARAIRQELANVYHDLSEDTITESKARTLAYIASIMQRLVETSELEDKIIEIEEHIEKQRKGTA